jgi:hypothetical protein
MDGYRRELCGAWIEYRNLGKVLAHDCRTLNRIGSPGKMATTAMQARKVEPIGPARV